LRRAQCPPRVKKRRLAARVVGVVRARSRAQWRHGVAAEGKKRREEEGEGEEEEHKLSVPQPSPLGCQNPLY